MVEDATMEVMVGDAKRWAMAQTTKVFYWWLISHNRYAVDVPQAASLFHQGIMSL